MSLEVINIGALPNDGTGDPLRTAFEKINNNFANLQQTSYLFTSANTSGNTSQVIFQTAANAFNQGYLLIESLNSTTSDRQSITISVLPTADASNVKYSGYGTVFIGNAVANYSMDVLSGNVRLICNPLTSGNLTHNIAYQLITS